MVCIIQLTNKVLTERFPDRSHDPVAAEVSNRNTERTLKHCYTTFPIY